jgi:hypothetical protein
MVTSGPKLPCKASTPARTIAGVISIQLLGAPACPALSTFWDCFFKVIIPNLFIRHPSAFHGTPKHLFPSVGAFDLCPGRDIAQRPIIREFLRGVLEALYAGKQYQEEVGLFSAPDG